MPGSVGNAVVPVVGGNPIVLPKCTFRSFQENRVFPVRYVEYHDGTTERLNLTNTSRRSWRLLVRLAPAAMVTMATFLKTHGTDPFYFYNPKEPASGQPEGSNYDPTGASSTGRYTVRLSGDLAETIYIPRTELPFELVEIA